MLPVATIEQLAARSRRCSYGSDHVVFRQGTLGARFYVIVSGAVDVIYDGRHIRRMGPGEGFGEIALLRACRRTTTVKAADGLPVELLALTRSDFVAAVLGVERASAVASTTVTTWLDTHRQA